MVTREGVPELGLVLPPAVDPKVLWPALDLVDTAGFGSAWVTDRTLTGIPWLESLTLLGAVAARTKNVRIGTSVLAVARRNPVYVAHALATAQYLSGGRLVAGIGLGGLEPAEYEIAGVPLHQRAPITDEYIGLLRRLWEDDDVSHVGERYQLNGIDLQPRPEIPIPIWIGGNSAPAHVRAGRLGDGWLSVFAGPEQFETGWAEVRRIAEEAGRDSAQLTGAAYVFAAVGRREGEAEAILAPAIQSLFGAPFEQLSFACLYGTPDRWVDTLARFGQAGASTVNVLLYSMDLRADVEILAQDVLPALTA